MINTGILLDIPSAEYHAAEAVSHSRLEVFRERPIKYYKRFVSKTTPGRDSKAFNVGRAAHSYVLEGSDAYAKSVAVWRGGNKVKAKSEWEAFQAANPGKDIITDTEENNIKSAATAIFLHPEASQLFSQGKPEITWRMQSNALPIPLQCRTDWFSSEGCQLTQGRPYVVDFKKTESLDEGDFVNFQKSFEAFGYHRQAGFYTALLRDFGVELSDFFFVAAEVKEPFGVDVYQIEMPGIAQGLGETLADLKDLARCYESNVWPNRATGIRKISCSEYYLKRAPQYQLT